MIRKINVRYLTIKSLGNLKMGHALPMIICVIGMFAIGVSTASAETEYLVKSENLKDLTSVPSALENLGLIQSPFNTVLGKEAFSANLSGTEDTILGFKAMMSSTAGDEDTSVGYESLISSTTGSKDTAVGHDSLFKATTGSTDVAVGNNALLNASTASENTALGNSALAGFHGSPVTGNRNTAVGREAGAAISSGERNTDVGFNADDENETGSENTAVGTDALGKPEKEAFSTSQNTAVGMNAGLKDEGNGNVFLGWEAGANAKVVSDMLYIGNSSTENPLILGNFASGVLKVDGKLEVTEAAVAPTKPTETEEAHAGTAKLASRKTSFAITGNGVRTKWTLKDGLGTRLVDVSVQKMEETETEGSQPGELELPTAYKIKPISINEVQITFGTAPAAKEGKYITVIG
jgi:hypothetical protein